MKPHDLEKFLTTRIPLAKFMHVSVVSVHRDNLILAAPLEPNANVHQTLFGGSAASIALIAAWSLLFTRMKDENVTGTVVVHRHSMTYHRPVTGQFTAHAKFATDDSWREFTEALDGKGRARIVLETDLQYEEKVAAHLKGEFHASRAKKS